MNVQHIEDTRAAAQRRIREEELTRLECALVAYEIEKLQAKQQVFAFCKQFGHALIGEWVHQHYEANRS